MSWGCENGVTPTAIRVFGRVLHLFQKVHEGIHGGNQNPQRPFVYCRGYPSPPPGVLQTFRNRVRVARVARVRVVCRVRYERVLERRLRAFSGITVCDFIVCVVLHEVRVARVCAPRRITQCGCYPHCSERWFASVCLWGGGALWHLVCVFLAGLWLVTVGNSVVMAGIGVVTR